MITYCEVIPLDPHTLVLRQRHEDGPDDYTAIDRATQYDAHGKTLQKAIWALHRVRKGAKG